MKSSKEVRETFLSFFEERGHRRVRSSSLIPHNDPTLLFTNAGMNQFKEVFLGLEKRDYTRATSSQKCMRVSGKHNDLETVGRTPRHHTFFEMLGNFSFGDYFKKEAIEYAWELVTQVYGLPEKRLLASVFREDDEAYQLWHRHIGLPESRIYRLGEKDNFWAMGETGPCGPCSELHFDFGESPAGHSDCDLLCECGRYIEIWNLVFMQYNRDQEGKLTPLPAPSIDTGMGLERITCVVQGVRSNYDTDLFQPLIQEACRLTEVQYSEEEETDVALRILADHSRACAFLISDGVVPGNEGRGYVLRKIMRRAIRQGRRLGRREPFLFTLASLVCQLMKDVYPELDQSRDYVARLVQKEEEKFAATLTQGTRLLDEMMEEVEKKGTKRLSGAQVFRLYDTYGFPLDLTREIAVERGLQVDEAGFYQEMEKQRELARASWKGAEKTLQPIYQELSRKGWESEFTGYEKIQDVEGEVLALLKDERLVDALQEGQEGEVILSRTPFYAEAGGQVGDQGTLRGPDAEVLVQDVFSPASGLRVHRVKVRRGVLRKGDSVVCNVFSTRRLDTARNHTATHLLHAALREVLGEHVRQAGSLVAPDRLRFDFSHFQPLTYREIREIEELVNEKIRENIQVQTAIRDLEEALQEGAMALFGEKYQKRVRVVTIPGFSMELCGGTHVSRTGDIAVFKIVDEGSISAGVRRVEAISGGRALERFLEDEQVLQRLAEDLHVPRQELAPTVERMAQQLKEVQKDLEQLRLQLAQQKSADALAQVREIKGIRVLSQRVDNLDRNGLRQLADQLKNRLHSGVVVLGAPINGKVGLVAMVTPDLVERVRADELIRRIAPLVDGGGGGREEMAEAGGKDPSRLDEALEQTYRLVAELVK